MPLAGQGYLVPSAGGGSTAEGSTADEGPPVLFTSSSWELAQQTDAIAAAPAFTPASGAADALGAEMGAGGEAVG